MTQRSLFARRLAPFLTLVLAAVLLGACDFPMHRGKTAHEQQAPVSGVTPNAVNKLPENINDVTITVKDGKFVQDSDHSAKAERVDHPHRQPGRCGLSLPVAA